MPGPSSATLHLDPAVARRGGERDACCRGGQNLSALSIRLATARSNSSTSSSARGPAPPSAPAARVRSATPWRAARSAKRSAMSSSSSPTSTASVRRPNSGSSSLARSPSDCTSRAALRVLRSAISTRRRSSARAASPAQRAVERLEAGDRRGQRRAQVVRQVADAFAPEVIECGAARSTAAGRCRAASRRRSSAGRTRRASARGSGLPGATAQAFASRPRCDSVATASVRRRSGSRHGGDDQHREQGRQRDDGERSAPSAGRREAAAQRVPARLPAAAACAATR